MTGSSFRVFRTVSYDEWQDVHVLNEDIEGMNSDDIKEYVMEQAIDNDNWRGRSDDEHVYDVQTL